MAIGTDPLDIYHNNNWYDRSGNLVMGEYWDDLLIDSTNLKASGANLADNTTEVVLEYSNAVTSSSFGYVNTQIPHGWAKKEMHPHIHWIQSAATANAPNWVMAYRWQTNGQAKTTSWTNLAISSHAFTYTSGDLIQISSFSTIAVPALGKRSDILQVRIYRDRTNTFALYGGSDNYGATAQLLSVDFHTTFTRLGTSSEYNDL